MRYLVVAANAWLAISLPTLANSPKTLSNEEIESLSKILQPEVVSSLYELKAQVENSKDPRAYNLVAAAAAGAAGAVAAKAVEVILDRIFGGNDKCEPKDIVVDDTYFDIQPK